jgi:hypothetical protein
VGKLGNYIDKLSALSEEVIEQGILDIIAQNEELITSMNADQLWQGKLADGTEMPLYSRTSVEMFGKPEGPWRMYETGDTYRGIFLHADKFPVLFDNRDDKKSMLIKMLTEKGYDNANQLFGISKENLRELNREHLKDQITRYYKSLLSPL